MNSPSKAQSIWLPIFLIMLAVTVWCVAQAVGTYLAGNDIRRPIVVLSAWLAFIGFWSALLYWRYLKIR